MYCIENGLPVTKLCHSPLISKVLISYSGWWLQKLSQQEKHFTQSHQYCLKWCYFKISWHIFMYLTWRVRKVAPRSSIKRLLLNTLQDSQEKICARVSFVIRFRLQTWNFFKKRLPSFPVNIVKFLRTPDLQTTPRVCFWRVRSLLEWIFAKFQIFTYIRTGNCFTLKELHLKIPEPLNRVIFQNNSEWLLLIITL